MSWQPPALWLDVMAAFGRGMAHGRADAWDLEEVVRCMVWDAPREGRGDLVDFLLWLAGRWQAIEADRLELVEARIRWAGWRMLDDDIPDAAIRTGVQVLNGGVLDDAEVAVLWRSLVRQYARTLVLRCRRPR